MTQTDETPTSPETPGDLLPETRRALDHRLATAQATGRAPSVLAAVVRGGRTVWSAARGELPEGARPEDVQYRIGSLTKTFTALLVLRLREQGLLALDDRLGDHLPAPHGARATVAQLLTHTAGLAAEARGPWWERTPGALRPELTDVFGEAPQLHPHGLRFHYSNPGYALLGALVERLRGEPWSTVLRREVLEPLGLERTTALPAPPHAAGWAVHPHADARQPEPAVDTGRMAPAGQLWSTLGDLAAFAGFLLRGDDRVLGAKSLAAMREPAAPPEGPGWESCYGLGLQLLRREGRVLAGHSGSMPGFVACLWTSPEEDLAAVALANATSGPPVASLAAGLLELVARREPPLPPVWRPGPGADPELTALTGTWYWGTVPAGLRLLPGRALLLEPAGGGVRGSRFLPAADGTWTGIEGYYAGETLRVVRGASGAAEALDVGTFVFTRRPYDPGAPLPGGADPEGWR
ncbi:serine hydrolase domain-containing protein [Streptomyces sp. DSM 44917]|uniref:Serine hydrolase domain-containing protein n=1 Tax=Streptomyces boetiae TaxID=3075541 RepID=A0ABU2L791_9ACTN|nr:serine hydrolase domain-containing protein [Streptomyces sp. DSM 44917]MDT0307073.1 serine hydrolase domain-containing protein [Streptomyces sp. DSM 44917]